MALYDFDIADAERFAREQGIRTHKYGNQLVFQTCPYCKGGKNHDKDTFAIGDNGAFNCKRSSCNMTGNMITLAKDFNFRLSDSVERYLERGSYHKDNYKPYKYECKEPKEGAVQYLLKRGISEEVCKKYEITMKSDNRTLIIPFRDENGVVWCIKYRDTQFKKGIDKMKEWFDCRKIVNENGELEKDIKSLSKPILFGMYQCESFDRLVITEGQLDSLACATAGIKNAVSVPTGQGGATWIPYCYDWMNKFEEIVVFGDCENGHITLSDMIKSRFSRKRVRIVRTEDYKGCKDANELLQLHGKQAVIDAIEHSEAMLNKYIIPATTVQYVDIDKLPRISTGIGEMDKILKGGFVYGQLVLLSGKKGNGKSTMASQFIVEALAQKQRVLVYSGELQHYIVKGWIDGQLWGKTGLRNSEIDICNNFYGDKLYLFDTGVKNETPPDVLDIIEDGLITNDFKFVLIDNLMTAKRVRGDENLYQAQSDFVFRLARMAKQYNTVIMLVAHPRKSNGIFDNDDVSGSADITNLADVVMSYDKDKDRELEDLRVMRITKNRLTGKLGNVDLWYSESSRRISDDSRVFDKNYFDMFVNSDEEMEIPFD